MSNINKTSGFWLGDVNNRYYDPLTGVYNKPRGKDIFALAGYRQAVANFVRIVTGENVPVKYANHDESYTDGKTVTLSGGINDGNFDVIVGLALHEGSHVKLTDFSHLKNGLGQYIPQTLKDLAEVKNVGITGLVKDLLNVVEDRRIDHFIFTTAPGYKGYYDAMYNKYFNAKAIDKALKEYRFREKNINDYMFHIVNFINENRTLDILPGLRSAYEELDLRNIGRLKTTDDALAVALNIAEILLTNLDDYVEPPKEEEQDGDGGQGEQDENSQQGQEGEEGEEGEGEGTPTPKDYNGSDEEGDEQGEGGSNEEGDEESDEEQGSDTSMSGGQGGEDDEQPGGDGLTNDGDDLPELNDLSPNQQKELENAVERQKDFMDGDSQKTKLSKKDQKSVEAAEQSGAKDVEVEGEISTSYHGIQKAKQTVRVYETMTDSLIESGLCNMVSKHRSYREQDKQEAIEAGFRLGMVLGKKLNARNDEEKTTYNRLRKGKISKRLISSIGTGNTKIFEQEFISMSKPSSIHLSIDASGSMNGRKFQSALTMATAIAKACEIVGGVRVRIDFRSTSYGNGGQEIPEVLIAYDSRTDKTAKIRRTWKHLQTPGTTPEGLCFSAIQKLMDQGNGQFDSYFINISDGEPYFSNGNISYGGTAATKHTAGEIKKMKQKGIQVLGYFLDGAAQGEPSTQFKKMYGEDSKKVDPNSVMQIAKTMNELLSRKS